MSFIAKRLPRTLRVSRFLKCRMHSVLCSGNKIMLPTASCLAFSVFSPASPVYSRLLSKDISIFEDKKIVCPLHSYHESIHSQIEKMKEKARPKSIIELFVIAFEKIGSCFQLVLRAVFHLAIFAPVAMTSWFLFFPKLRLTWYHFLMISLQVCGATFVKLGQWAATRPDILPLDMCRELSTLYSTTRCIEFSTMKKIIERELGQKLEDVFDEIDLTPLGSGCIAQVYRARLKNSNDWVVLKVKRPHIDAYFQSDLQLLSFLSNCLATIPCMQYMKLQESISIFTKMMYQQLDFRIEAVNLIHFRENFKDDDQFVFPDPYLNLTTPHLLVESFEEGTPLPILMEHSSSKNAEIAYLGFMGFLHMLLVDNFLHADLHPGNILVRESVPCRIPLKKSICHRSFRFRESHSQLVFLDTGLVNELEESQKRNFVDIFIALAQGNGYEAGRLLVERAPQPSPPVIDPEGFMRDIGELVNENMEDGVFNLANLEIANALTRMMSSSLAHHVTLDCRFVNLFMSVVILEGVGRQLDKNLNIIAAALPVMRYAFPQYGEAAMSAIKENPSSIESLKMAIKSVRKTWRTISKQRHHAEEAAKEPEKIVKSDNVDDLGYSMLKNLYDKVERTQSN